MTPLEPSYRLADHVRACAVDDQVILLDLHRNKYLGIGGTTQLATLARAISDWPAGHPGASAAGDRDIASFVAPLVRQGMVAAGIQPAPNGPVLCEPLQTMASEPAPQQAPFEWRQLISLWVNAAVTSHCLRHRTLAQIVEQVSRRKEQVLSTHHPAEGALRAAVESYTRVRPFAFTAHDRCLHDSLTLIRFLTARQLFAHWVIGVRTNPFGAHSWVQSGHVVLNDLHENVRRYRPILVV
jgi:hypothetical protein